MSISVAATNLSAVTAPMHRPPAKEPMLQPGGDKTPTEKPDVAPMRKDFTAALQAMLLRAQEAAVQ